MMSSSTTSGNNSSTSTSNNNDNNNNIDDAMSYLEKELEARQLYEKRGQSSASLQAYRHLWESHPLPSSSLAPSSSQKKDKSSMTKQQQDKKKNDNSSSPSETDNTNDAKNRRRSISILRKKMARLHNEAVLSRCIMFENPKKQEENNNNNSKTSPISSTPTTTTTTSTKKRRGGGNSGRRNVSSSSSTTTKKTSESSGDVDTIGDVLTKVLVSSLHEWNDGNPNSQQQQAAKKKSNDLERQLILLMQHQNKPLETPADDDDDDDGSSNILPTMIMKYNLALTLLSSNRPREGRDVLHPLFHDVILPLSKNQKKTDDASSVKKSNDELMMMASHVSFLLLDCMIHASRGDPFGLSWSETPTGKGGTSTAPTILHTIERTILSLEERPETSSTDEHYLDKLKFRFHLYKARVLFLRHSSHRDVKARQSKKELKSALEIHNHKLRSTSSKNNGAGGGTQGSVGSHSDALSAPTTTPPTTTTASFEVQSQLALCLKAHLELTKGNAKKSLKLVAEAKSAGERHVALTSDDDDHRDDPARRGRQRLDDAMHYNNLGILHQSVGKIHIAMHYYAAALRLAYSIGADAMGDGTPSPVSEILHNASVCAMQAGKWRDGYECMAKCVMGSPFLWRRRARCWLRMGECCINIHFERRRVELKHWDFSVLESSQGISSRLIISPTHPTPKKPPTLPPPPIASPADIDQITSNPLPRALYCFRLAFRLAIDDDSEQRDNDDDDTLQATRLNLAYVMLELNDPRTAYHLAMASLEQSSPSSLRRHSPETPSSSSSSHDGNDDDDDDVSRDRDVRETLSRRRRVMARLYACEALCEEGDGDGALALLRRRDDDDDEEDGADVAKNEEADEEVLDRLARDLSLSSPSSPRRRRRRRQRSVASRSDAVKKDDDGDDDEEWRRRRRRRRRQRRFDDAMSVVYLTMSGIKSCQNDVEMAERYARLALESAKSAGGGREWCEGGDGGVVLGRKALFYCAMKRGNRGEALSVLREMMR